MRLRCKSVRTGNELGPPKPKRFDRLKKYFDQTGRNSHLALPGRNDDGICRHVTRKGNAERGPKLSLVGQSLILSSQFRVN